MATKKSEVKKPTSKPAAKKAASSKAPAKKTTKTADFPAVFDRLKAILTPYAPRMVVVKDDKTWYYLDTKMNGKNKKPIMFGAVRSGKAYVSFYLTCAYCLPQSIAHISPELKKRMQGKSCFNFTSIDDTLFAELESLTKTGADWFRDGGLEKILAMQ